jgi:hypothetical protein
MRFSASRRIAWAVAKRSYVKKLDRDGFTPLSVEPNIERR